MKKKLLFTLTPAMLAVVALTSCGGTPEKFVVNFMSNGGSQVAVQYIKKDGTVTKPTDPIKDGYTFGGWYSDEALTKVFDFATVKVTSDTCIYAKWEAGKVLTYDEAKNWVAENYKDNSKTPTLPKSVESNWGCHTYITKYQDDEKSGEAGKTLANVKSKMGLLFKGLGYCKDEDISKTIIDSTSLMVDEIAFYTKKIIKVEQDEGGTVFTKDNYFNTLNSENFDDVMNYFYSGFSKNMCNYTINEKDKSLKVNGTLAVADEVFNPGGTKTKAVSLIRVPNCEVNFSKDGTIRNITFNFKYDSNVTYVWYNETITSWSNYFEYCITKGSYIEFNYNF